MSNTIQITPYAYDKLHAKKREVLRILKRMQKNSTEPIKIKICEQDLEEVDGILKKAEVTEFSEKQPAVVLIGTKIVLENLKTTDKREYTIMSRSTANPMKGVISYESPLGQKMLGLKLGNTFKFRDFSGADETYKIKSIE
jgi:transcription elongation factor GreA